MANSKKADILCLIDNVKSGIELANRHSLKDTARLLKIALLDLQMKAHRISDKELRLFADELELGLRPEGRTEPPLITKQKH